MARSGLVTNHRSGWPSPDEIWALGLGGSGVLRSICYDLGEYWAAVRRHKGAAEECVLIKDECAQVGQDYAGWDKTIAEVAAHAELIQYCELDNEPDLRGLKVDVVADRINRAYPVLAKAGIQVILPGVASPHWQDYLAALVLWLSPEVKANAWANLHPYGQRAMGFRPGWGFGEIDDVVKRAHEISGMPVCCTETGIKRGDAGGDGGQEAYVRNWHVVRRQLPESVCPFMAYFAWCDAIGAPDEQGWSAFGLRDQNMQPRPAWYAYQAALSGAGTGTGRPAEPDKGYTVFDRDTILVGGIAVKYTFKDMWLDQPALLGKPRAAEGPPSPGAHLNVQAFEGGLAFWSRSQLADQSAQYREIAGFAHLSGARYMWDPAAKQLEEAA